MCSCYIVGDYNLGSANVGEHNTGWFNTGRSEERGVGKVCYFAWGVGWWGRE
ncbi:hypothetical protein PJN25_30000 [Mycobacterium kansasii]